MTAARLTLLRGDCESLMATLPEASVDAIVTDPPYGIDFMGAGWDSAVPPARLWRQALRVLKPGGHLIAFSGTRTYHRMACAIEDAGFEVRDMLSWLYGSGFPKSLDVSKAIDRALGVEREVIGIAGRSGSARNCMAGDFTGGEYSATAPATADAEAWQGWGTALKPACEPAVLARRPLAERTVAAQVLATGTGALNIDGCRIEGENPSIQRRQGATGFLSTEPARVSEAIGKMRNRTSPERYAEQRPGEALGRWPANVMHDGSPEVLALFPDTGPGSVPERRGRGGVSTTGHGGQTSVAGAGKTDSGSAARFFYTAKADGADRRGSDHPTVKPIDLMRWLVRMVTPPGGVVLDPFAGTGTTLLAAHAEGFRAIGCEMTPEYQADIARAIAMADGRPDDADAGYRAEIAALIAATDPADTDRLGRLNRRLRTDWRGAERPEQSADLGPLFAAL